ncbi:hypothetical protein D910_02391 [Dendroctonus ponderosae]|uniref:Saposin A-type domain-containing protein n=1 Tax=Dendroctonus ponderosae TaxID=77166 RepID=U4TY91_DENPD|nr:hypothetical protein D910_02391 [Dendroctonus ponderosae]
MKFLAIFALVLCVCALAFAVPQKLVGSEKCTRGPGYWCKDRQTAEECKAVQHCETKVWNKN